MPTPLELLTDPVSLAVFAVYGALMLWEAAAPARRLPEVRLWRLRGLATFALYFMSWLQWNGGALKLTELGENVRLQLVREL